MTGMMKAKTFKTSLRWHVTCQCYSVLIKKKGKLDLVLIAWQEACLGQYELTLVSVIIVPTEVYCPNE